MPEIFGDTADHARWGLGDGDFDFGAVGVVVVGEIVLEPDLIVIVVSPIDSKSATKQGRQA